MDIFFFINLVLFYFLKKYKIKKIKKKIKDDSKKKLLFFKNFKMLFETNIIELIG